MKLLVKHSLLVAVLFALLHVAHGERDEYADDIIASFLDEPAAASVSTGGPLQALAFSPPSLTIQSATAGSGSSAFKPSASEPSGASSTSSSGGTPSSLQPSEQTRAKVRSALDIAMTTQCNPSVCFALVGSAQLSDLEFRQQIDFTKLVSAIISLDEEAAFAALQYTNRVRRVSALTKNATAFLLRIDRMRRRCRCPGNRRRRCRCAAQANVWRGVRGCARALRDAPEGGVKKMVVFGDARGALGAPAAGRFLRDEAAGICGVQIGGDGDADGEALREVVGEGAHVLTVDAWNDVVDVVDELVRAVCDAPPPF